MGVSVDQKGQHSSLRPAGKPSILGKGMLERARATTLALLGLTAAVGLAMVALVLNQNWPLVAAVPIPGIAETHQAVGDATIAAEARAPVDNDLSSGAPPQVPKASVRASGHGAGGASPVDDSEPSGSGAIVVSESTPAPPTSHSSPGNVSPSPVATGEEPAVTPVSAAPSTPTLAASPAVEPSTAGASTPPSQPPVSSTGTAAPESSEESTDEDEGDEDYPPEEEEDADHDYSRGWHHGHGHGHW